jgi:hypothetical protein
MPRGGKRQGTQGKGYSNRTDLAVDYAPGGNPASGGMEAPRGQMPLMGPAIGADMVANLGDPTGRPDEPVTAGLPIGPGAGMEAMGPMPPPPTDPMRQVLQAMMLVAPNADVQRLLNRLNYQGR